MTDWLASYPNRGHRVEVPAATLAEADAIAKVSGGSAEYVGPCLGRPRYRTRAAALAAGPGPAYPCPAADHWHAAPLEAAA